MTTKTFMSEEKRREAVRESVASYRERMREMGYKSVSIEMHESFLKRVDRDKLHYDISRSLWFEILMRALPEEWSPGDELRVSVKRKSSLEVPD